MTERRKISVVRLFESRKTILRSMGWIADAHPDVKASVVKASRSLRGVVSATRMRSRCSITGRARSVNRKFSLSRMKFRELAFKGILPGVMKWKS